MDSNIIKLQKFQIAFHYSRSESPTSSTQSSPPISPGCEDQNMSDHFHLDESFKRPMPPEMRHQNFQPLYNMYQPQLLLPNNSAFHRPDASGKPIPVGGLVTSLYLDKFSYRNSTLKSFPIIFRFLVLFLISQTSN